MFNCVLLIRFFDSLPPKFPKIFFHSLLAVRRLVCQLVPFLSSSPKGVDDQSFHTYGEFFPFWAAAPKGTKSCRTQGDFRSSFRPSVHPSVRSPQALSGLKSALSGLKFTLSDLKSALSGLESVRADFRPERTDFRPGRADLRPERADSRPERQISGLRG